MVPGSFNARLRLTVPLAYYTLQHSPYTLLLIICNEQTFNSELNVEALLGISYSSSIDIPTPLSHISSLFE